MSCGRFVARELAGARLEQETQVNLGVAAGEFKLALPRASPRAMR